MIEKASLRNFMVFEQLDLLGFTSLNVIVGLNDTGKTALLKMLYAPYKTLAELNRGDAEKRVKVKLADKLNKIFMPRRAGSGHLVRKGSRMLEASFSFKLDESLDFSFGFGESATHEISQVSNAIRPLAPLFNSLFIPAKEILTQYSSLRHTRELYYFADFDDTMYDLAKSLALPVQPKNTITKQMTAIYNSLDGMYEGQIIQNFPDSENPFLYKRGNAVFTMPLTAEGIKKLGLLTILAGNREIGENTLLFLDEPETALHPAAQRQLAEILFTLSKVKGVQIFLTTHGYFMLNQLEIIARREKTNVNCISLSRDKKPKR